MGKKFRLKMLGDKVRDIVDSGRTIDDGEATMKFISPIKMEIIPKIMTPSEFHLKIIKRLNDRHLNNKLVCYMQNNKVILEVLM